METLESIDVMDETIKPATKAVSIVMTVEAHRQLKARAAKNGTTIQQMVTDWALSLDDEDPEPIATMDDAIAAIHKLVLEQATPEIREQVRGILREIAKRSK